MDRIEIRPLLRGVSVRIDDSGNEKGLDDMICTRK